MTTKSLNYKLLHPNIHIYTDLLPDADELYRIAKESEKDADGRFYLRKWEKWAIFGTYAQQKFEDDEPREFGTRYEEEKYLSDRVYEAYSYAIDDYISKNNIVLPNNSRLFSSSFSKYDEQVHVMQDHLTMQYHTDYIISEKDMPGDKFFITCTTYLNDDYDGGDICFYIDGQFINHKPKAGEILVFPSTEPYYHGVKAITRGNKFLVRNFIVYSFDGTEEWLKNQKRYGAYRWGKMEQERIDFENPRNMIYFVDNKMCTFEELLSKNNYNYKM